MADGETIKPVHPTIYILPNLLTTGSIFVGFLSMVYASYGNYYVSFFFIIFGACLDGLDGKVARITKSASAFGVQYDSLADVITFGLTPAFVVFQWKLYSFDRVGLIVAFLYTVCGALRLARFNISAGVISKKYFIGLPIPVGAGTLSSLYFFSSYIQEHFNIHCPDIVYLVVTFIISLLMVSPVKYFSFKEFDYLHKHPFMTLLIVLLCLGALAIEPALLLFVFAFCYIMSGILYSLFILRKAS